MKALPFFAILLTVCAAVAVPNFDPFADASGTGGSSYDIDSNLVGQNNATLPGPWYLRGDNNPGAQPVIADANLSYPNLPGGTGNSVLVTPSVGKSACIDIGLPAGGHTHTVYYSFLLQVTDLGAVDSNATENPIAFFIDDPSLAFTANTIARRGARLLTRKIGESAFVLGTSKTASTNDSVYEPDDAAHNLGDVLFVVASHQRANGVTNVHLWVNPPIESFGAGAAPTPTLVAPAASIAGGALNSSSARGFAISCQFSNAPSAIIDELRVSTNWAYVTGSSATITNPVSIVAQPVPRKVMAGSKAVFSVGVSGTEPLTYQWLFNGSFVPDATTQAYTIADAQVGNEGDYSVIVTGPLNSVTSSVAALTIVADVQLSPGNVAVIRVGDGAQTLTANGNSISLDQFSSGGSYVSSLNLPDSGPDALITMGPNSVPSPSSVTGTTMSRSLDGRQLVIAGYNTDVGYGSALNTASATVVPRGVGFVDSAGQYVLGLSSTDTAMSSTFFRSAVSDGTNDFWGAARSPGTYYFGSTAAPTLVQNTFANIRSMGLFNGSIYCVSAVSGNSGVMKLDGTPTSASSTTILFSGSTGFSDLEVSPSGNIIYVADDRGSASGGGVQRWEFDGSTWNRAYTLTNGVESGVRYVAASFSGPNPIVYAVTREASDDNNRLVIFQDTGVGSTGTTVAYSGANQNFRGIRLAAPEAPAPIISVSRDGNTMTLSWDGTATLQSANSVEGPYAPVIGATSPHPVSTTSGTQFFRLEQ